MQFSIQSESKHHSEIIVSKSLRNITWMLQSGINTKNPHSRIFSLILDHPFLSSVYLKIIRIILMGLPWWLSGEESTFQCRRRGFDPWSGKTPPAVEQLSLWATTIKPVLLSQEAATAESTCLNCWSLCALGPMLQSKRSRCKHAPQLEWALLTTRGKPIQQRRPSAAKTSINKIIF